MRNLLGGTAVLLLSTAGVSAATVDLTYTINAAVSAFAFSNGGFEDAEYFGPAVGTTVTRVLDLPVDLDQTSGVDPTEDLASYSNFDSQTGAIDYAIALNGDEDAIYRLFADGTGTILESIADLPNFMVSANVYYEVTSWTVEGLPDVAPVPLPASLPILALGLGAIGVYRRRTR